MLTELALTPAPAPAAAPTSTPTTTPPAEQEPQPTPPPDGDDVGSATPGVDVGAGANLGDHTAGVAVVVSEEPAVGVSIDDQVIGTAPTTTPEEPGITIVAGPVGTIGLP